ncbi:uncharacterized protein L969DRAFT_15467 [Mixia osmundae IAM 14324]|uniref:uncharacterized protein n=1 Tax=Mixia osmundae (strain CBS 9802 / IAM 14324 / JCM 22182 / KY 12970) TaxID=764103 RepID=UPI0004A54968|nr:uncharacterized protein L969DRAFT_15467 [Mixia osmundae IAM 14324]KEI41448.1 hypothetical protein L969DRAFT_15467 [Mixia osmundae IAM 14324]
MKTVACICILLLGSTQAQQHFDLVRRARPHPTARNHPSLQAWATRAGDHLAAKYGHTKAILPGQRSKRRRAASEPLINVWSDSEYVSAITIGTPGTSFDLVMDTGSGDMIVASSSCSSGCTNITNKYDTSSSSTSDSTSTAFEITYGSGSASGTLVTDVVAIGGLSVTSQVFADCDKISNGLLQGSVTGLMGLGFKALSTSGATPFWQNLADGGLLPAQEFAFALTRFVNATKAQEYEPGGIMTLGGVNDTLYSGDIAYHSLSESEKYWQVSLSGLAVGSTSLSNFSTASVALDTGTSLIGAPDDVVASVFALIPGSSPATDPGYEGYYTFPCDASIDFSVTIDSIRYPVSDADFNVGQLSQNSCLGALFALSTSSSSTSPQYILGDSFIKNYYTVFRYKPTASIGFATLSAESLTLQDADIEGLLKATGLSDSTGSTSDAASLLRPICSITAAIGIVMITMCISLIATLA